MSTPVKIPADLEHPDKVLAGLTARQVLILASTALLLYTGWLVTRTVLPLLVYLVFAAPGALGGAVLAFARRNGIGMDRHAAAAAAYRLRPRILTGPPPPAGEPVPGWLLARAEPVEIDRDLPHLPAARTGRLTVPVTGITAAGAGHHTTTGGGAPAVLDLGGQGCALIAAATPVPFGLRDETEQAAIVACFARLLHAADAPIQILVRAQTLDLAPAINEIAHAAATLPHPALRAAAADHHAYLTNLATGQQLLTRQILLVLRDLTPTGTSAHAASAHARLVSRLGDATRALAPAGIGLTPLLPAAAEAVLATAFDPDRPITTGHHRNHHPDQPGHDAGGQGGWAA